MSGPSMPIAIIGLGCRFPQASNPAAFWELLDGGVDAVSPVPPDRWDREELYDATVGRPGKINSRFGGFLADVRGFDPAFFGISPREALDMDPQQRLLLEVASETFESAGYANDRLAGSATGVFIGIGANDYSHRKLQREGHRATISPYTGTGQAHSIAANRLSYTFDLRGPSMALDTACSSSLIAVNLACRSIGSGESDLALAGGVSLMLTPETSIAFSQAHMLAADGRCKSFDAAADGYVRGEGCGLVLLKPLAAALRDGDPIAAVIAGGAMNQDGRSNGLTAPSGLAQLDVVRTALAAAAIEPHQISFVEAHGTGTPLGDPIEVRALATALAPGRPAGAPAVLGSVKTNIGHLECASGVAGLIKVVLALAHERIPRNLNFSSLNPLIDLAGVLEVAVDPTPWPRTARPRYAGVSSYGFGGANSHVVVTEPPAAARLPGGLRDWHLVTLSAKSEPALRALVSRAQAVLAARTPPSIGDVAYTTTAGRTHFSHRYAIPVRSIDELRDELDAIADERASARVHVRRRTDFARPKIGLLFSGQGAQYPGMARGLRASSATFRTELDRCAAILDPLLERPLLEIIDGGGEAGALDRTANTQPALFAVEYALAKTWLAWGVEPHALLGHSVGEYVAAVIGGMLSLPDAARLVALRGRRMQDLTEPGAMAALLAPAANVVARLGPPNGRVAIAAINGPASTVISGAREDVERIVAAAKRDGIAAHALTVSHAFHSALIEPMLDAFESDAGQITARLPDIPVISNVTGRPHFAAPDAGYWRRHAREAVDFAGGVGALLDAGCDILLEVGPDATLCGLAKASVTNREIALVPSLRRGRDDWRTLCDAAASLYVRNAALDWRAFARDEPHQIVAWPTTPFEREPYWSAGDPGDRTATAAATPTGHPLLGQRITAAQPLFSSKLSLTDQPYLADHALGGSAIFPATGFVELGLAAAAQLPAGEGFDLVDLTLRQPLFLDGQGTTVQTQVRADALGGYEIEFSSRRLDRWTTHGTALLRRRAGALGASHEHVAPVADGTPPVEQIAPDELYRLFGAAGLDYGPAFRGVRSIERFETLRAQARIEAPPAIAAGLRAYRLHPAVLDACFQVAAATVEDRTAAYIPVSIERVRCLLPLPARVHVRVRRRPPGDDRALVADLQLIDDDGRELAAIRGLRAERRQHEEPFAAGPAPAPVYTLRWEPLSPEPARAGGASRWLAVGAGDRGEALVNALRATGATVIRSSGIPADMAGFDGLLVTTPLDSLDEAAGATNMSLLLGSTRAAALAAKPPRLVVCTAGAQAVLDGEGAVPAAAALWGFAATVALEHPELRFTCIDVTDLTETGEAAILARLVVAGSGETRVAVRGGVAYGARLAAWDDGRTAQPATPGIRLPAGGFRIESARPGSLDALSAVPAAQPQPPPGHVVIAVAAAGLNFRDVMKALGIYPSARVTGDWLGDECAGVVTATGADVAGLRVGDRVMALAPAAFGRFVVTRAELVAPIPDGVDDVHAAAIPVAYCTAWYGLAMLAGVRPGERVLVHAAAGGVGFAAVAVAQALGAEVYATAGSDEKRAFVRSLGVKHVFDSRSLDFVEDIRAATGGAGVDVALNSLAGEAIPATLSILAPFGRFIEIGKKDIYGNSRLPMQPFARNVSFAAVDMDALMFERPELARAIFADVTSRIAAGTLPVPPVTSFALTAAPAAFRHMAQARQIGKIVLTVPAAVERAGSYIVTGGLGGLGPQIAGWLQRRGVTTIVLAGRQAPDAATAATLEALCSTGASIVFEQADVADAASVAALLTRVRGAYGPLRGIVHAAGVLDDGVMLQQTSERFARVCAPKLDGAYHLDRLTAGDDLDAFILFSSAAAVFGSPGQSNYAAANAGLGALAHRRRALGNPGLAVNWGPWSGPGMASRAGVRALAGPVQPLEPAAAFEALDRLIAARAVEATVIAVDWERWGATVPGAQRSPLVRALLPSPAAASLDGGAAALDESAEALRAALLARPAAERVGWLEAHIATAVAGVTDSAPERILPADTPIRDLGVDSLMGLELQLRFETELGVTIPRAMLMQSPSIHELALATLALVDETTVEAPAAANEVALTPVSRLATATFPAAAGAAPSGPDGHSSSARDGRTRLLCFAHAGTGGEAFRGLERLLGPDVHVVPVEYPGRNRQRDRSPATTMDELVNAILPQVDLHVDGPFALFGHSLGALVGFEVARALEASGRAPRVLFASGSRAPSQPRSGNGIAHLDHDAFVEQIGQYNGTPRALLSDSGFMQLAVPVLKADFSVAESYAVRNGVRIATPIVAFGGDADPYVQPAEIRSWSTVTTGPFASAMFAGDHFFLASALTDVATAIASYLGAVATPG